MMERRDFERLLESVMKILTLYRNSNGRDTAIDLGILEQAFKEAGFFYSHETMKIEAIDHVRWYVCMKEIAGLTDYKKGGIYQIRDSVVRNMNSMLTFSEHFRPATEEEIEDYMETKFKVGDVVMYVASQKAYSGLYFLGQPNDLHIGYNNSNHAYYIALRNCTLASGDEKKRFIEELLLNGYRWDEKELRIVPVKEYHKLVEAVANEPIEQKPKFHEGDWVVQKNLGIYKIVEVCESWYEVISYKDGIQYSIGFDKENDCHLWTIQEMADDFYYLLKDVLDYLEDPKPKFDVGDTIRPKGSKAEYTITSISGGCYHGKGWGLPISAEKDYELVEEPTEDVDACNIQYASIGEVIKTYHMNYLEVGEWMTLTQFRMELESAEALFSGMVGRLFRQMLADDLDIGWEWLRELVYVRKYTPEWDCYNTFLSHGIFDRFKDYKKRSIWEK